MVVRRELLVPAGSKPVLHLRRCYRTPVGRLGRAIVGSSPIPPHHRSAKHISNPALQLADDLDVLP